MADELQKLSLSKICEVSGEDAREVRKLDVSRQNIGALGDIRYGFVTPTSPGSASDLV